MQCTDKTFILFVQKCQINHFLYLLVHDGAHELFDRRQGHIGGVEIHGFPGETDLQQKRHAVKRLAGVGRARGARAAVRQAAAERGGGARGQRGRERGGRMRGDGKRSWEGRRGRAAARGHLHSFGLAVTSRKLQHVPDPAFRPDQLSFPLVVVVVVYINFGL